METATSGEEKSKKNPLEELVVGDLLLVLRPGYVWHFDPRARPDSEFANHRGLGRLDTPQPAHPVSSGDILLVLKKPFWDNDYSESMLQIHVLYGEVPYVLRVSRRMLALNENEVRFFQKLPNAND